MRTIKVNDVNGTLVEIPVDDALTKQVLVGVRQSGKADKRFDLNLKEGQLRETELANIIGNSAIEVKTDFMVSKTGNMAIETFCNGNPSGITATEAEWWAFFLEGPHYNGEVICLLRTARLRKLIQGTRSVLGGDGMRAEMSLLPVKQLLTPLSGRNV